MTSFTDVAGSEPDLQLVGRRESIVGVSSITKVSHSVWQCDHLRLLEIVLNLL